MPEALTPEVRAALDECRDIISKGSKSFSLAAQLFDPQIRDAAVFLYGWCRYCDDQVDDAGASEIAPSLSRNSRRSKKKPLRLFPSSRSTNRYSSLCNILSTAMAFRRITPSN